MNSEVTNKWHPIAALTATLSTPEFLLERLSTVCPGLTKKPCRNNFESFGQLRLDPKSFDEASHSNVSRHGLQTIFVGKEMIDTTVKV
jgi:hypothetical protein